MCRSMKTEGISANGFRIVPNENIVCADNGVNSTGSLAKVKQLLDPLPKPPQWFAPNAFLACLERREICSRSAPANQGISAQVAAESASGLRTSRLGTFECGGQNLLSRGSHLWSTPVPFSFCRTYDVPRQSTAAYKALEVLKTTVLKRLASAVQLRPWPPSF
jgi:hypothetical protein